MEEAEQRLREILGRAEKLGVPPVGLVGLCGAKRLLQKRRQTSLHSILAVFAGILSVTFALVYYLDLHTHSGFSRAWLKWNQQDLYDQMCTIHMPDQLVKIFRPPEDCAMCEGLTHVEKVSKISPNLFENTAFTTISKDKYKDIMNLIKFCSVEAGRFFTSLPHDLQLIGDFLQELANTV
ncbi:hypothetical protein C0J52_09545 [Blattella germanica]|nr:hypothetical protein C0J52_09545 [Blattella germanica]